MALYSFPVALEFSFLFNHRLNNNKIIIIKSMFLTDGTTPSSVNHIIHQVQEDSEALTSLTVQTCDNPHSHIKEVYVWHKSTDESAGSHQSSSQHHHYSRSVINDEGTRQRT